MSTVEVVLILDTVAVPAVLVMVICSHSHDDTKTNVRDNRELQ